MLAAACTLAPDAPPEMPPEEGPNAGPDAADAPEGGLGVRVLSNRADLLSGGDALVELMLPQPGTVPPGLVVEVDGRDVTGAFALRPGSRYVGLVRGLRHGRNVLTVRAPGVPGARIALTNHRVGGPIFAGRQVKPWRCATQSNGLGAARDNRCNTPAVHEFFYRSAQNDEFLPYNPASPPPASDIATTTTDQDHTVPYIVRRERGVIDRGIYDIAVLYEPGKRWKPWAPQKAWNRKLYWTFGGSCQPYHAQQPPEGRPDNPPSPGVLIDRALSRGFAVASSAMTVMGSNCNTVVAAEALMMVKEHLIETYGPVRFTFAQGGSGGSMGVLQVAEAYPGLLDGIIPRSTFVDLLTTATEIFDCRLLVHYFTVTSPRLWDAASMRAAEGAGSFSSCRRWVSVFAFPSMLGDPTVGCITPLRGYRETDRGRIVPSRPEPDWVYHPVDNPDGVRCTIFDYLAEVFGRRPGDGFTRRPYDNVGVQYGLQALLDGAISPEQFADLNTKIGGLDIDLGFQPARTAAGKRVLDAAYRSGQVVSGGGLDVPIVDASFAPPAARVHTAIHSWKLRERLALANGSVDNHVILQGAGDGKLFRVMDRWLTRMAADTAPGTQAERVVRSKPAGAVDSGSYGPATPRIAAGAPVRDDVLKCRLQPLDRADYAPAAFTDDQWDRLEAAFPQGVCDWTQPGIGQTVTVPWATYEGDGLEPLGPPPRMQPLPAADD